MRDAASSILAGIRHSFDVEGEPTVASPVFQRNVFLIFKEAIHNAARHSLATVVHIKVSASDDEFELVVSDNGKGFDAGAATSGIGQKTMARRSERIGGRLSMESEPGSGTRITLVVKMAQTRE